MSRTEIARETQKYLDRIDISLEMGASGAKQYY